MIVDCRATQCESTPADLRTDFSVCRSVGKCWELFEGCGVGKMAARNTDKRTVKKMRTDNHDSSWRTRSASFSGGDDHTKHSGARRSNLSRSRYHHHGFPFPPAWSEGQGEPEVAYLPGKFVGYKRMWMQGNPWPPACLPKETGSKRDGGQGDHLHRMKFREQKKLTQTEQCFVPGGTSQDPLNLKAVAKGEELPGLPPIPEPDPSRHDVPVNNFIPINQHDPLGLTLDDDDQTPVALKYPLRPKRKRSRCKKKDNFGPSDPSASHFQSQMDVTDGVSTFPSSFVASDSKGITGSENLQSFVRTDSNSEGNEGCDVTMDTASAEHGAYHCSGKKTAVNESLENSETDVTGVSGDNSLISHAETSVSRAVDSSLESGSGVGDFDSILPGTTGGAVCQSDENACLHKSTTEGGQHPVCDERMNIHEQGVTECKTQEMVRKTELSSPPRIQSANQQQSRHGSEQNKKSKQEFGQKLKELKRTTLNLKQLYPVPQSPLDEQEKEQVPKNRKSLKKALRIEPIKSEEQAKVNRDREKKEREFKRLWRYPNLKSPDNDIDDEKKDHSDQQSSVETLKVDTSFSPEKPQQEQAVLHGPLSRIVDSIISPVLRPDPSQIRKRRRTVSECNDYAPSASKRLNFRRSSSPDVRVGHLSPRKIRRQTSGSGQKEQKTTDQEKQQGTIKFAKNPAYKHGNYYRYYGYRTPDMAPDFRLFYFRKEWFEGKDVLDIGCNAGDVTLAVAQCFHPQKIVGMDIDPNLIRIARQNIRKHQSEANMYQMEKYPVSVNEYGPIESLPALTNPSNMFPKNVMFMQGNYVLKSDKELDYVKEEYDTILALSITKWIHLNHGDEGLKLTFERMFQQLRPGGQLILEPQTWASYRRRKNLSPTIYKNYNSIKLKPNTFADYLVGSVGFCKREFLGQPFNPSKGFQRPLWLFTKYKETPDGHPSPEACTCLLGPPPVQSSINERITYLAGYSPYPSTSEINATAGPSSPSPAVLYRSRYLDTAFPSLYPLFPLSSSSSDLYHSQEEPLCSATHCEKSGAAEDLNETSSQNETGSQREGGESLNSSGSSASFSMSYMSTDSPTGSSFQDSRSEQLQTSSQDMPYGHGQDKSEELEGADMNWQEEGENGLDEPGPVQVVAEPVEQEVEDFCNGGVDSEPSEEDVYGGEYGPDSPPVGGHLGEPAVADAFDEPLVDGEPVANADGAYEPDIAGHDNVDEPLVGEDNSAELDTSSGNPHDPVVDCGNQQAEVGGSDVTEGEGRQNRRDYIISLLSQGCDAILAHAIGMVDEGLAGALYDGELDNVLSEEPRCNFGSPHKSGWYPMHIEMVGKRVQQDEDASSSQEARSSYHRPQSSFYRAERAGHSLAAGPGYRSYPSPQGEKLRAEYSLSAGPSYPSYPSPLGEKSLLKEAFQISEEALSLEQNNPVLLPESLLSPAATDPVSPAERSSLEAEESPTLKTEKSPPLEAEKSPPLEAEKSPPLEAKESPPLKAKESPTLEAKESPTLEAKELPPLETKKSPTLEAEKSPTLGKNSSSLEELNLMPPPGSSTDSSLEGQSSQEQQYPLQHPEVSSSGEGLWTPSPRLNSSVSSEVGYHSARHGSPFISEADPSPELENLASSEVDPSHERGNSTSPEVDPSPPQDNSFSTVQS